MTGVGGIFFEKFASKDKDMIGLHLGDCLDVMKSIDDKSVDLVLTDIPYGVVNRDHGSLRVLDKGAADTLTFNLKDFVKEVDKDIEHFDQYGDVISTTRPDYWSIKKISAAYKKLKTLLPDEEVEK